MINDIGISQTLKINEYCKKTDKKINKLGFGQSPFSPPDFFKRAINENIDKNDYLPVQGLESLRDSIADHYKNFHNVNISKDVFSSKRSGPIFESFKSNSILVNTNFNVPKFLWS